MPPTQSFTIPHQQKEFLLILGYLYLQNTKYHEARIIFEALHLLFPKDYHVIRSLAYAYLEDGEYEQAIQINEEATHATMSSKDRLFFHLIKSKALWRLSKTHQARQSFNDFIEIQKTIQ